MPTPFSLAALSNRRAGDGNEGGLGQMLLLPLLSAPQGWHPVPRPRPTSTPSRRPSHKLHMCAQTRLWQVCLAHTHSHKHSHTLPSAAPPPIHTHPEHMG